MADATHTAASPMPNTAAGQRKPAPEGRRTPLLDRLYERFDRRYVIRLLASRERLLDDLQTIPGRMEKVTRQVELVLELARDYHDGTYRALPWYSLAGAVIGLLYAINPADLVPDAVPILGSVDDIIVLALVTRLLRKDLVEYCTFKGRDPAQYF